MEDIPKGKEVYVSYGELKPNVSFFFSYGFVDSDPDIDEITIKLKLDPQESSYETKKSVLL